jgi:hypothetical protein
MDGCALPLRMLPAPRKGCVTTRQRRSKGANGPPQDGPSLGTRGEFQVAAWQPTASVCGAARGGKGGALAMG